ncbi:hypothetical protein BD289DRAFT_259625 [Coniella lustricola]|uniref:Uncharacterized protein n=1 Tax=Coniella lustricola TaxID=2025994 RepID=A0A2T3A7W1_9PEZI|nr:hypothetical protein BD289DRAFT_259625 [Coniella lustricola]
MRVRWLKDSRDNEAAFFFSTQAFKEGCLYHIGYTSLLIPRRSDTGSFRRVKNRPKLNSLKYQSSTGRPLRQTHFMTDDGRDEVIPRSGCNGPIIGSFSPVTQFPISTFTIPHHSAFSRRPSLAMFDHILAYGLDTCKIEDSSTVRLLGPHALAIFRKKFCRWLTRPFSMRLMHMSRSSTCSRSQSTGILPAWRHVVLIAASNRPYLCDDLVSWPV